MDETQLLNEWVTQYHLKNVDVRKHIEVGRSLDNLLRFAPAGVKRESDSSSSISRGRAEQTEHNLHSGLTAEQKNFPINE